MKNVAQTGSLRGFDDETFIEATQTAGLRYVGAILDLLRIIFTQLKTALAINIASFAHTGIGLALAYQ